MRVLVCGGRNFTDEAFIFKTLDGLHRKHHITRIIHGGARGADQYAGAWAAKNAIKEIYVFDADWDRFGLAAGPHRNQRMLHEGRPELVVAFPGGRGTNDMVRRAMAADVRLQFFRPR
jgi:SLOG family YspA-like protein